MSTEFIKAFYKENKTIPFWYMRQAGRYLPEYREIRQHSGGFLDMCYTPAKAVEVTLQPIRRFSMSAAIIFSDILVIPHAMGLHLAFEAGEGPILQRILTEKDIPIYEKERFITFLKPVYDAISQTRLQLNASKSLIGFAGAPWTLACYMIQGKGGKEFGEAREMVHRNKILVKKIIDVLTDAVADHLIEQITAGANAIQLFDSWAGLAPLGHEDWLIIEPAKKIRDKVKKVYSDIPMIGFPKGFALHLEKYAKETSMDGIGVDMQTPLEYALKNIPDTILIQGNLDPLLLAASKDGAVQKTKEIVDIMRGKKFIFNLGHGIVPHTPIENVEAISLFLQEAIV